MTAKKSTKKAQSLDLIDHALSITGDLEPLTINVGDVEITLRRSHTGQQVVEWQKAESERVADAADVLADTTTSEEKKAETLRAVIRNYARNLLRSLAVEDTPEADIAAAAELIAALPADSRTRVFRTVGELAGVVDEDGNPFRSSSSSVTKSGTAD